MKRRFPVFLLLGCVLVVLLVAVFIFNGRAQLMEFFADYTLRREARVDFYLRLGHTLYRVGQLDELQERLEDARGARDIDFYVLQQKGQALFWGHPKNRREEVDLDYQDIDRAVVTDDVSYITTQLDENTRLTVGIFKFADQYIAANFAETWRDIAQYIVILLALTLLAVAYFFRDILEMVRALNSASRRNFDMIQTRSIESEMFKRGLSGYETAVDTLQSRSETLGRQILPSLRSEILSGRRPPYDFACTMVRTDINNFSSIYNTHPVDEFMRTINDFFTEVSHIVSRYGGFVHEFVGDEVIYYFKDEHHVNSFAVALSAARDINAAAERFHAFTTKDAGYPFTVKSSVAHGMIRFGRLVNGFSLAGSVLIETVRILSQVTEKEGNVLYFDATHAARLESVCRVREAMRVQLKGFAGERQLVRYDGHVPLSEILEELMQGKGVDRLTYYRSDEDLVAVLHYLNRHCGTLSSDVVFPAIRTLRTFTLTKTDGRVERAWSSWINHLLKFREKDTTTRADHLLSAVAMLGMNLIPPDRFSADLEKDLSRLLQTGEKRVVANALEVLSYFKAGTEREFIVRLIHHESSRISANALVNEGQRDLSGDVPKVLRAMISSGHRARIASALYAIGEIARYHRERDLIYYNTQIPFLHLVERLPELARNRDKMIRRQALVATKKSGDSRIRDEILHWAERQNEAAILMEAREVLGLADTVDVVQKRVA